MSSRIFKRPIQIGYLEKKKSSIAINTTVKWVKRWFCLYEDKLLYFFEKEDLDPCAVFWLRDVSAVRTGKDPKNLELVVEHSSRVLTLRAKTAQDVDAWMKAIHSAVYKVKFEPNQENVNRNSRNIALSHSISVVRYVSSQCTHFI
jgi:hypothetical protein